MQAQQQKQPQTLSVRVLRPFYFAGKPTKVDETLELPRVFALEMKAANKAALVQAKVDPEPKKPEVKAGQKALV